MLKANTTRKLIFFLLATSLLTALLYMAVRYYHIDYHIRCRLNNCFFGTETTVQDNSMGENRVRSTNLDLVFDIHNKKLDGIQSNLSGLAYDHDQNLLIAVLNSPQTIVILNAQGSILRQHPVQGANDTEGIAYLGNGKVALLQEKRRSILIFDLPKEGNFPIVVDEANAFKLDIPADKNNGPEGLAYDVLSDTFYVVKERKPVGLYAVQGLLTQPEKATQRDLSYFLNNINFVGDLSGIAFDASNNNLLLLSDEAQMLFTFDLEGTLISHFDLAPWNSTLPPPQPEGVTIGDQGTIFVVSEPNLFYRLRSR